jgi:hypothetical protein
MDELNREIAQYYLLPSHIIGLARLSERNLRFVFADEHLHDDLKSGALAIAQSSSEADV